MTHKYTMSVLCRVFGYTLVLVRHQGYILTLTLGYCIFHFYITLICVSIPGRGIYILPISSVSSSYYSYPHKTEDEILDDTAGCRFHSGEISTYILNRRLSIFIFFSDLFRTTTKWAISRKYVGWYIITKIQ